MFPVYSEHSNSKKKSDLISRLLQTLDERCINYFPAETFAGFDWVRDPWNLCAFGERSRPAIAGTGARYILDIFGKGIPDIVK